MVAVASSRRTVPVELSADAGFAGRVRRLAATSVVGLGAIALLSLATLDAPPAVHAALLSGWALMPALLVLSLRRPRLRYGLVLPSLLVGLALVAICAGSLPESGAAATGWILLTAGVALGGLLGVWFWFRVLPVPTRLDDPFSPARWALVGLHVALVVAGLLLVAAAAAA